MYNMWVILEYKLKDMTSVSSVVAMAEANFNRWFYKWNGTFLEDSEEDYGNIYMRNLKLDYWPDEPSTNLSAAAKWRPILVPNEQDLTFFNH